MTSLNDSPEMIWLLNYVTIKSCYIPTTVSEVDPISSSRHWSSKRVPWWQKLKPCCWPINCWCSLSGPSSSCPLPSLARLRRAPGTHAPDHSLQRLGEVRSSPGCPGNIAGAHVEEQQGIRFKGLDKLWQSLHNILGLGPWQRSSFLASRSGWQVGASVGAQLDVAHYNTASSRCLAWLRSVCPDAFLDSTPHLPQFWGQWTAGEAGALYVVLEDTSFQPLPSIDLPLVVLLCPGLHCGGGPGLLKL